MFNECRHIKNDGARCGSPALKGKPYCYFHMKFEGVNRVPSPQILPIEDSTSILLALGQVIRALRDETISSRNAGRMLYALQIAASVVKQREHAKPAVPVRSVHNVDGEPLDFHEAYVSAATMLAPENTVCEPPHDCAECRQQETCTRPDAAQFIMDRRIFAASSPASTPTRKQ
ncbi:hypothetical protein [Occallatibacter savannae]|uniref:hypothetical protein n=1 Tax=Occallatibacter savannae TaxID=1002691 RepID=UPI000D698902|nr:hypothetical protein [Occallatibacter savannae]